jgi:hypothetical protein
VLGWLVELLRAPLAPSSPVVAVETTSGMHQAWVSELERQVAQQVTSRGVVELEAAVRGQRCLTMQA